MNYIYLYGLDLTDDPVCVCREEKSNEVCSLPPIWPGPMACMAYMPKWTFTDG